MSIMSAHAIQTVLLCLMQAHSAPVLQAAIAHAIRNANAIRRAAGHGLYHQHQLHTINAAVNMCTMFTIQ